MPRVIVASPKYLGRRRRLPPRDLDGAPGLLFPYEGFAARWKLRDRNGELEEVQPKARVVASDGLMLRDLAVAGEGVALLPRWLCAEELASGSLVDVAPRHDVTATEFGAEIALLYPSRAYLPTKVRAFIDYVSELFRGGPPWEQTMR
jgi:DNA-binding transcriptional LysR family regulator